MEKIIAIDYGLKRTGIAYAESPLYIAHPLVTINTNELFTFLSKFLNENKIIKVVLGEPKSLDGSPTDLTNHVVQLKKKIIKTYSDIEVVFCDERFTSKIAQQSMVISGVKKKQRQKKENLDLIAAVIILQSYLEANSSSNFL